MYVSLTIGGISKYLIKYILQYIQVKYVSLFVALFDKNKCKRASTSFICFLVTKAFSLSKTAQTASTDSIVAAVSTYYTTTPCGPFKYLIYSSDVTSCTVILFFIQCSFYSQATFSNNSHFPSPIENLSCNAYVMLGRTGTNEPQMGK